MKKLFLLLTVLLISALNVNAANWQTVNSTYPGISVLVDTDSIKPINNDEFYYAIRYTASGQSEKIAYMKANIRNKTLGIIQSGDYEADNYRPNWIFDNPHVLMKPAKEDSFLYYTNDRVASMATGKILAVDENEYPAVAYGNKPSLRDDLFVAYTDSVKAQDVMTPAALNNFLSKTSEILKNNWNPPAEGYGTKTIVQATIGIDGSLLDYKILKSSNVDKNNRSVIAALEKTVPYPKYVTKDSSVYAADFQFIFVNDMFKKAVVY